MRNRTRLAQSGAGCQPEKHRLRTGATAVLLSSNNLVQSAAGAVFRQPRPNFSKKGQETLRIFYKLLKTNEY